jgi:diguanylate cyclase (GGDEF)-like protein
MESSPTSSRSPTIRLLVACRDPRAAQRVAAAMDGDDFSLQAADSASPLPDVIVTDQPLVSDDLASLHHHLIAGDIGVILIGHPLPADVRLPADFTRRELRLAARLLAQVVHHRRQTQRWMRLAESDPLTGLPNRRGLVQHFRRLREQYPEAALALAMFDLDDLKSVNTNDGYALGDETLRGAAKTLAARAKTHAVARWGGDEFVMVWRCANSASACEIAEQLRTAMGTAASLKAGRSLSVSAGLAHAKPPVELDPLLDAANTALRQAKQAGGKRLAGPL